MKHELAMLGRTALLALVGGVCAGTANAETVAWWRFENGSAGTTMTSTNGFASYAVAVPDFSGNGNHLVARDEGDQAVLFTDDIPPLVTGPNTLAMRNRVNERGGLMTWSAESTPASDIESMEFEDFTVEMFFKPTAADIAEWTTFVGWDGAFDVEAPVSTFPLAEESEAFKFYRINITAVAGGGGQVAHINELSLLNADGEDVTGGGHGVSGTATASSVSTGPWWNEIAQNGFDNDPYSIWTTANDLNTQSPAWLQFELNEPAAIASYQIVVRNGETGRHPSDWTLEGSHDGETWTVLDTQTGFNSYGAWPPAPAGAEAQTLDFQLAQNASGRLRFEYMTASQVRVHVDSPNPVVANHWYFAAGVKEGNELRLYLADLTAGESEPKLVATTALTQDDTRMLPRPDIFPNQDGPVPRASWSVGRGYYNSSEGDKVEGPIDEVRISNHAVPVSDMLLGVGVPVELDSFVIE